MKKENKQSNAIGHIELENGKIMAITPMNDWLLNYTFDKKENWETLREIVNIFIEEAKAHKKNVEAIEGKIEVKTQLQNMLDNGKKRRQDFVVTSNINKETLEKCDPKKEGIITGIEFQNRSDSSAKIETRSMNYLGLNLTRGEGKEKIDKVQQIWIFGKNNKKLMGEFAFCNSVTMIKETGKILRKKEIEIFISLPKVAELETKAGELARFLLYGEKELEKIIAPEVKQIATVFKESVTNLKKDEEVQGKMTYSEIWREEGIEIGMQRSQKLIEKERLINQELMKKLKKFEALMITSTPEKAQIKQSQGAEQQSRTSQMGANSKVGRTPMGDIARMKAKVEAQNKPSQSKKNKGLDR